MSTFESESDRTFRRSLPSLRWRFAAWLFAAFVLNFLHAAIRPWILRALPTMFVRTLYLQISTTFILTFTVIPAAALVAAYYYALRDRRIHTAMGEFGLAVRSTVAGIAALGCFVLALVVNYGTFLPK